MDICFEGVGQVAATFQVKEKDGEDLQTGMAVTLKDSGTVELGANGDEVCGVLLGNVRGGTAAVQISGVAKVGYSGDDPNVGWQELACDGTGKLTRPGSGGMKYLVLAVDEDKKSIVVRL